MDINIILGVILVMVFAYFLVLLVFLWRRNKLVEQAHRWNNFRDELFTQAQKD